MASIPQLLIPILNHLQFATAFYPLLLDPILSTILIQFVFDFIIDGLFLELFEMGGVAGRGKSGMGREGGKGWVRHWQGERKRGRQRGRGVWFYA
jgi:hypothetical protein